ncbi:MAG: Trk system potassium transporter TrkA [Acetatifactor sp.]|nr:Trk system potassium transporter TrkA [Acetatifactor sp.]
MKIIIVGMSHRGMRLADLLAQEGHDVVAVDNNRAKIDHVTDEYSVSGVVGSGVAKEVLLAAGAETADVIVAMSHIDEVNLMTCMIAKKCGTRFAAARIFQPELSKNKDSLKEDFLIDYLINPKLETADQIVRQIGFPGKIKVDAFFDNNATMIRLTVEKNTFAKEVVKLSEVKQFFGTDMLITNVLRDGKMIIPDGDFEIKEKDVLSIIAGDAEIQNIILRLGMIKKPAKKVFIVGGGDIAYYLSKRLLEQKLQVTVMEYNMNRCKELSELLPGAKIVFADGLKADILLEEGIEDTDVCISLTGSDENNLVISLFAWSLGIPSIITKVESADYEKLLNRVNMDITVSPSVITVDGMLRFVRDMTVYNENGQDIASVHQVAGGLAQAIEFSVFENCKKIGIPLKSPSFGLKKHLLIAMIVRGEKCLIPDGNDTIQVGDRVVVIASSKTKTALNTINDIFE